MSYELTADITPVQTYYVQQQWLKS